MGRRLRTPEERSTHNLKVGVLILLQPIAAGLHNVMSGGMRLAVIPFLVLFYWSTKHGGPIGFAGFIVGVPVHVMLFPPNPEIEAIGGLVVLLGMMSLMFDFGNGRVK